MKQFTIAVIDAESLDLPANRGPCP